MSLDSTILERNGTVLTPGSLMARFKEWSPCASLADPWKRYDVRPRGCTDSRLSLVKKDRRTTRGDDPKPTNKNKTEDSF